LQRITVRLWRKAADRAILVAGAGSEIIVAKKKASEAWASVVVATGCIALAAIAGCANSTGDDQGNPTGEDSGPTEGDSAAPASDSGQPGSPDAGTIGPDASQGSDTGSTPAPDGGAAGDASVDHAAGNPGSPPDAGADAHDATAPTTADAGTDARSAIDAGAPHDATTPDTGSGFVDASLPPGTLADAAPLGGLGGSAGRPMLTTAQAADYGVLQYLARAGSLVTGLVEDDWNPTAGVGDVTTFTPNFTVQANTAFPTVQSAINAATGTSRVFIRVMPGTYNEVVCVLATRPPITLYSTSADATQTVIVFNNYAGLAKAAATPANTCVGNVGATTFGTSGSSTFTSLENGIEAKNITFSNDVSLATLAATTGSQAVALYVRGDKLILDNVRAVGHQDTLLIDSPSADTVVRAYMTGSFVSGDVDYVFGAATSVFNATNFQFVSDRRTTGTVFAPDTNDRNPYGMLAINSQFTSDSAALNRTVGLGRAWDSGCTDVPTYVDTCVASGSYPNGQTVVRSSAIGAHISLTAPWEAAATTNRPFSAVTDTCATGVTCPPNRLYEFMDTP
jgi:pectinesterase